MKLQGQVTGDDAWTPIGTCVEGIAVEFSTPGLGESRFLAVANYTGRAAPRTDVARSMIENTKERADALKVVNMLYANYIRGEVTRLQAEEKYSLTYATEQIPYLTGALRGRQRQDDPAFDDIINQLPAFLVEREEVRVACSLNELGEKGEFWLAESELLKSIGELIKQAPRNITSTSIYAESNVGEAKLPMGTVVMNAYSNLLVRRTMRSEYEIGEIHAKWDFRRIDTLWKKQLGSWIGWKDVFAMVFKLGGREREALQHLDERRSAHRSYSGPIHIPVKPIVEVGLDNCIGAVIAGEIYLLPHSPVVSFLLSVKDRSIEHPADTLRLLVYMDALRSCLTSRSETASYIGGTLERHLKQIEAVLGRQMKAAELIDAVEGCKEVTLFDPFSWVEREVSPGM
jgi:molecular chaperone HtpG